MIDRIGQQLGNYQLIRLEGVGSFARVYVGKHMNTGWYAAIKILANVQEHEGFFREADTLFHLRHPHIVRVFEYGVSPDGYPFLVMDYASHGTLRKRHRDGIALPLSTVVSYGEQIAEALDYLHKKGLVHLDVKPANVLVQADETLLLSDFGIIARAHSTQSLPDQQQYAGTPAYMAPEHWRNAPRPASDQYALAVMVYQWLTGRLPFEGSDPTLSFRICNEEPPPLRNFAPTLSSQVEAVVLRALHKDFKRRYPDVLAFVKALQQASIQPPEVAKPRENLGILPPGVPQNTISPTVPAHPYSTSSPLVLRKPPSITPFLETCIAPSARTFASLWWQRYLTRRTVLLSATALLIGGGTLGYFLAEKPWQNPPVLDLPALALPPAPSPNTQAPLTLPSPTPTPSRSSPSPRPKNRAPQQLPNNLYLGDIDGDGADEFLQVAENRLLAFHTNFGATGVLHHYLEIAIERLFIGDFTSQGQEHGYDQVCALLTDGTMRVFVISNDLQEMRLWFSQNNFITQDEVVIVGDFDGDGADEILLHNPTSGMLRLYSRMGTGFFAPQRLVVDNLNKANLIGKQILAGRFKQPAERDDLLLIDRKTGQISRYDSLTDNTGALTFQLVFTTQSGILSTDDQVVVANIDNGVTEGIIIYNSPLDLYRMCRAESSNGNLVTILNVPRSQLPNSHDWGVGMLVSARTKTSVWRSQPGGTMRHDFLYFNTNDDRLVSVGANGDGSTSFPFCYCWAFTRNIPTYHQGWPTRRIDKWAVLLSHLADNAHKPQPRDFFKQLFTSIASGGLADYFRDISYGTLDLSSTEVLPSGENDEWYKLPYSTAPIFQGNMIDPTDHQKKDARKGLFDEVVRVSGVDPSKYRNILVAFNVAGTGYGGSLHWVVIDPGDTSTRRGFQTSAIAQQMLLGYGLSHSRDDQGHEYGDPWDVMSADQTSLGLAHMFIGFNQAYSGPELNATNRTRMGFFPANRVLTLTPDTSRRQTTTVILAAVNRPEASRYLRQANGTYVLDSYLAIKIPVTGGEADHAFYVEFRQKSFWDRAIPKDAILVHEYNAGKSFLQTGSGGPQFIQNMTFEHPSFTMTVKEIHGPDHQADESASTALIEITY